MIYFACYKVIDLLFLDVNECASSPCLNDGACGDWVNRYNCYCLPGYTGQRCETGMNTIMHNMHNILNYNDC